MNYILMDYVQEAGWPQLSKADQERWLGAYRSYMGAMTKAGILRTSSGLKPTSSATTVRVRDDKPVVLDGPYADTKEQLGGFHIIEVPDLDAAISWAALSPTALHGVVEVRPLWVSQLAQENLIDEYQIALNPVILGKGRTLIEGVTDKLHLKLTKSRTFQNGNVFLTYEPAPAK